MRVLVTGATGFVGQHVMNALLAAHHEPIAIGGPADAPPVRGLDLTDAAAVAALVNELRPEGVIHLAAQASVPAALRAPLVTLDVNAIGTAYLLEGVRAVRDAGGPSARVVVVSSAEVYGAHARERMPLDEAAPLRPANPYAASKVAAEACAAAWVRAYGLDVVIARPFNHIGPGQDERFVVASFAAQLARIAAGGAAQMLVGNLEAQRDFLDVRDVAAAYVALLEGGVAGEVYNIAGGQPVAIREVLRQLITIGRVAVEIRDDPERLRASDTPLFSGDASKLRGALGWTPSIPLAASLRDIYADAQARIAVSA